MSIEMQMKAKNLYELGWRAQDTDDLVDLGLCSAFHAEEMSNCLFMLQVSEDHPVQYEPA